MTILRVVVDSNGKIMGDAALVEAPEVVMFGGKVRSAPWSPPAKRCWARRGLLLSRRCGSGPGAGSRQGDLRGGDQWRRVAATGTTSTLQIFPIVNPANGSVTIVALNLGTSAQHISVFVAVTAWPASVTPHVTSASANLTAGAAINLTADRLSASLPGQSVTTFVGKP